MDMSRFPEYHYDPEASRAKFECCRQARGRKCFFITADDRPDGEILLKHIETEKRQEELSVHLQNDAGKMLEWRRSDRCFSAALWAHNAAPVTG